MACRLVYNNEVGSPCFKPMTTPKVFKQLLFVLNPISGDIDKEDVREMIVHFCRENHYEAQFYLTTGTEDAQAVELLVTNNAPDIVVAVGGDGTVSLVAKILNHGQTPLGIIPLGSGNGLSKDLGIPQDAGEALQLLRTGKVRAIDSLDILGHNVFHLADLGFNARIVKIFCEGNTRGPGAYARIAFQEYLKFEPHYYKIVTDQETFEGPAFMLTIANANAFGSNAAINPGGIVDDGFFEICLLEPFPKTAALGLLINLYTDTIQKSVYSRILKCRYATIYKQPEDVLQIDGESVELGNELQVKLHKRSLQILVPAEQQ
jgi:diacylglycerol kinase (ATP)